MIRSGLASWKTQLALVAVALAVVLAAPLASPNKASADVVIAGARSLSDQVSVSFDKLPPGHMSKHVHLLAFNDLHGTLDPAGQTLYGQFAGGAAFLAKKVKDLQGPYGAVPGDDLRRRQHRREPARERAVPRRADHDRLEPDARRLRVGREPRVRRGLRRASPRPERRLPSHRRLPGGSVRTGDRRDDERLSGRGLPVPVGERRQERDRHDALPGIRRSSSSAPTDGKRKFKVGFIGEVARGYADDRHADRRRGSDVPGRGGRGEPRRRGARRPGRQDPGARRPPGRLPESARPRRSTAAQATSPAATSPRSPTSSTRRSR